MFPLTDVAGQTKPVNAMTITDLTAAGAGDNTEVTGLTINRAATRTPAQSVSLLVNHKAVLAEAKTLSITIKRQESADGSSWDTAVTVLAATVVSTGGVGGSTEKGVYDFSESLDARKQYVRYNVTPDLSATGTDTARVGAVAVLGGYQDSGNAA